jgi:dCMP deaminase
MTEKDWDLYFLRLAKEVSKNSKCLSRQIGSIVVRDKSIIGAGYNGAPRGVLHCEERTEVFYSQLDGVYSDRMFDKTICPRRNFGYQSGKGLHLCQAGHAERNALIQCAREGISTKGATLYCNCPIPCKDCMIEIINSGISRLVYFSGNDYDSYSRVLLRESNMKFQEYSESDLNN